MSQLKVAGAGAENEERDGFIEPSLGHGGINFGAAFYPPPLPMGIALRARAERPGGDGRLRNNLPRRRQGREKEKEDVGGHFRLAAFFRHGRQRISLLISAPGEHAFGNSGWNVCAGCQDAALNVECIFRYRKETPFLRHRSRSEQQLPPCGIGKGLFFQTPPKTATSPRVAAGCRTLISAALP